MVLLYFVGFFYVVVIPLFHALKCKFILILFSWLVAPEVVKMTISGAASHENFIRMTTFISGYWIFVIYLTINFIIVLVSLAEFGSSI